MADTETPPTDAPSTDAPPADAPSSGQVFEVGTPLDRTAVLFTSDVDTWNDPNTPPYPDADDGRDADGYRYRIAPAFRGAATQRPADRRGDGRSGA